MDFIRPIGPVDRDIDPVHRVERATDEREDREQPRREPRKQPPAPEQPASDAPPDGPVEGDDGHLHIDIRA
ncbi:MAG: hypothetical protein QOG63_2796 [Thermoleophilaceae bacterium]|jgi:hypothetical protein|nr:hypothetical protein [Thermoleophilaceae bacterium]